MYMNLQRILCCLVAIGASLLQAQDPRGTIRGRISDPTGSTIPGAAIKATSTDSGVTLTAKTNESGNYSIPFLLPGFYTVTVEVTGFKQFRQTGVQVRVGETIDLNITMEIGAVAEQVEVTAETPLLDTAGASLGQVIDTRRIQELPVSAGNPLELTLLTPGMVEPSRFLWKAAWNFRDISSDGNRAASQEFQIDGVSNTFADGQSGSSRYAFAPPQTAVREFKTQTSSYDASVGHTPSSLVNVTTASGTNELHGEAHWALRHSALDAPNFFQNRNNVRKAVYRDNRYGASAGGPVVLPKVYNGKNRTFWHYAWEANKWGTPQSFTGTVPTEAQRQGDFSALLALGPQYQIYDPQTSTLTATGQIQRQPFAGNIIPRDRLDSVGLSLAALYPLPNQPGTVDGRNNYFNGGMVALQDYYVHLARVDHAFSENHRMFGRVHYDFWEEDKDHRFGPESPGNGIILNRVNKGLALDDVLVLSPTLVLNVRYGLTHQDFSERRISRGFDLASLGFGAGLISSVDSSLATVPRVTAGPYAEISRWELGDGNNASLTHSVNGTLTKLLDKHNMKFGGDFRAYRSFGNRYPSAVSPVLQYSTEYTRGPLNTTAGSPIGQEMAALLLGLPGGYMDRNASFALQDKYFGLFFQDDFRVSTRLTLNLGLRYELETPVTERFDRLVGPFDATTPNPVEAQARAAYAQNPIPELPVENFSALGGLTWVNQNGTGRSPWPGEKNNFQPRIGFSWQVAKNTVLRGGYGMFFDTIGVNTTAPVQIGFSQRTLIQASLNNGLTYVASNANPFPAGLIEPLGANSGLTTNLGQSLSLYSGNRKHPYSQRWSFGVQQLLPAQFLLETGYVGNRGTRLPVGRNINAVPLEYLSTSPVRDDETIRHLTTLFPNPFYGTSPTFQSNITRADLLRPYPQFVDISILEPIGYSWYHSLQTRVEKRFSQGYTFQLAYTWSKLMEATSFLNAADAMPYEMVGNLDRPHRLAMSGIWEIPVGRGRKYGSNMGGPLNFLVGGWQLNGIASHQSGAPLNFGNIIFNGDLKDIPLSGSERNVDRWFNTEAGFERNSSRALAWNVRGFPQRFGGIRADARSMVDLSLIKYFQMTETTRMQFRAECYNALNHANFNGPDTNPVSGSFGRVTSAADGRSWQFQLRLDF
jgi:hypothetical protein